MSSIKFTLSNEGGALSGDFTRHTVPKLANKIVKQLLTNEKAVLDLKEVDAVDTAGLAWLLALVEAAEKAHKNSRFLNFLLPTLLILLRPLTLLPDCLMVGVIPT